MKYLPVLLSLCFALVVSRLQKLNINEEDITVSGVSSGGAFATQMHVAYSSKIKGAALFATPPYYCAQNVMQEALTGCMKSPWLIGYDLIISKTESFALAGWIDSLSNLEGSPVYIFSGTEDTEVVQGVVATTERFYSNYRSKIFTEYAVSAQHSWVTSNFGSACDYLGSPYINKCNYNSPLIPLQHILQYQISEGIQQYSENLKEFDQSQYGSSLISFGSQGYIYVPKNCEAGSNSNVKCGLHIAFHGCEMTVGDISNEFAVNSGLNTIAEANNLVILYPQVKKSTIPYNPKGCWDWWGYTGVNYPIKIGPQLEAIWKMVQDLTGVRNGEKEEKFLADYQ